jgi:uncharacterized membrane protein
MSDSSRKLLFRLSGQKDGLTTASLIAIGVFLLALPYERGLRIALAYDLAVATFLALQCYRISRVTASDIQDYYEDREPSSSYAIIAAVVFSGLSMAGVGLMADISKNWPSAQANIHTFLSLLAIVLSWILLHTFYAFHYAHLYYDVDESHPDRTLRKGLSFPEDASPDYWDFHYYSFTIAMCFQTSDVTVTSQSMRRVTLFHAILSFLYVTAVLGLVINILSNQI